MLAALICLALAPVLYCFLTGVVCGYQNRRRTLTVERAAGEIAALIAKVKPGDHGQLFSQVGSRLVDLGAFHTAGACYRVSVEIYPDAD